MLIAAPPAIVSRHCADMAVARPIDDAVGADISQPDDSGLDGKIRLLPMLHQTEVLAIGAPIE